MGLRFFTLQMIPWCFQLHHHLHRVQLHPPGAAATTIKLVKSDGLVLIYHQPIHVSDLMLEFPRHLVCRSDSFYIGQKIPALSEDEQLQPGHKYFLLPQHLFQSVLSFVTIASFSSKDSAKSAFLRKAGSCEPFDIQKTSSGCLSLRVSDEFISQLLVEGNLNAEKVGNKTELSESKSRVCTTAQLQKDYTQLVGSRQWKPRLEPIRETREKSRRLSSSFGMRRLSKKKSKSQSNSQMKASQNQKTSVSPGPSKPKIKAKSSRK